MNGKLLPSVQSMQDNVSTLLAAIDGHTLEHGVAPDFVLMSADVARAIFAEVKANSRYHDLIKIGGDLQPMKINHAGGIEIGQIVGSNRVELVSDLMVAKAKGAYGRRH